MVFHGQILFSLAIAAIAEAILRRTSAEQVPSLHKVAPKYWTTDACWQKEGGHRRAVRSKKTDTERNSPVAYLCHFVLLVGWPISFHAHRERPDSLSDVVEGGRSRLCPSVLLREFPLDPGYRVVYTQRGFLPRSVPLRGDADAELKFPSGENTELKRPPFKA